jgi:cysteine synthase/O-phosphoserine sulfhydrylase/cystathionine beta-synthase
MSLESLGLYDEVTGSEARVYGSVLELVRRDRPTPLVMIKRARRARLWAKLEWYNPLSLSIKDRTALSLVEGKLDDIMSRGKVYEASSSNTGVAVSALSRIFGFSARLYIPETAEQFGPDMIRAMGQEVVVKGSSTAELRPLVREEAERDGAVFLNQFESYYNPLAHIRWTAKEIDLQSRFAGLRLKAIFATMGTAGHVAGLATYFRARRPEVKVVGVQPAEGSSIPGIRRHDKWPWPLLEAPAEVVDVSDEEAARVALEIARETGLLPGLSGGASIAAALRAAEGEAEEADYIVVVPDHGVKYLRLYSRYLGA